MLHCMFMLHCISRKRCKIEALFPNLVGAFQGLQLECSAGVLSSAIGSPTGTFETLNLKDLHAVALARPFEQMYRLHWAGCYLIR